MNTALALADVSIAACSLLDFKLQATTRGSMQTSTYQRQHTRTGRVQGPKALRRHAAAAGSPTTKRIFDTQSIRLTDNPSNGVRPKQSRAGSRLATQVMQTLKLLSHGSTSSEDDERTVVITASAPTFYHPRPAVIPASASTAAVSSGADPLQHQLCPGPVQPAYYLLSTSPPGPHASLPVEVRAPVRSACALSKEGVRIHGTDTGLADLPGRRCNPSGEMFRTDELTCQPTKAVSEQILPRTRARKTKEEHGRQVKMRQLFSRLT